jgi:hypothetical protein
MDSSFESRQTARRELRAAHPTSEKRRKKRSPVFQPDSSLLKIALEPGSGRPLEAAAGSAVPGEYLLSMAGQGGHAGAHWLRKG